VVRNGHGRSGPGESGLWVWVHSRGVEGEVRWDAMGWDARLFLIWFDRRQSLSILKPLIQN